MKRKKLFLLMIAFLLIGTSRVVGTGKIGCNPCQLERNLADVLLCIRDSSGTG